MNQKQFEKFYKSNFDKIYRFFILRSLSKEVAEDLTSSTFLAFAESVEAEKLIKNERNYLYGIAKLKLVDFFKIKYQEVPLEIENINIADVIETASDTTQNQVKLSGYINRLIESLPKRQRIVMQLRIFDKLKLTEIADELGKDLNYVKTTQKRALKKLREIASKVYTL